MLGALQALDSSAWIEFVRHKLHRHANSIDALLETLDSGKPVDFCRQVIADDAEYRAAMLNVCDHCERKGRIPEMDAEEFLFTFISLSLVHLQRYDARVQLTAMEWCSKFKQSRDLIETCEQASALALEGNGTNMQERQMVGQGDLAKRIMAGGFGFVVAGVAVGLSAGLAAPLVLPSLAAIVGGSTGAFLASAGGAALFGVLFGAAGGGLSGYKVSRHFEDITDFEFIPTKPLDSQAMSLRIVVPGWHNEELLLDSNGKCEEYILAFERKTLEELNSLFMDLVKSSLTTVAVTEVLKHTVLATALAAIVWPVTIIQLGSMIDNPWHLGLRKAEQAGKVLAQVLLNRVAGNRPIDLIGYGLGALLIYHCLHDLVERGEILCGLLRNVVLLGLPLAKPLDNSWTHKRALVHGRFVQGYAREDVILKFLFRTSTLTAGQVVGLAPLDVPGIESIDLSNVIDSQHLQYHEKLSEILAILNL